jgi:hypothetical protein
MWYPLVEVFMRQCLANRYAVCRIEMQQFSDQVLELHVDGVSRRDVLLPRETTDDEHPDQRERTLWLEEKTQTSSGLIARTSFLLEVLIFLCFGGQSSLLPSLKNSPLVLAALLAKVWGIGPMTASIMARCSRLSCVWKSAEPV